ncbi:MAG: lysophospholipid acyltransferase family protein [Dehalococcoidia bacterium]|nr:lysophospholipid acyltransferase family protein [Dehalococcoidia bacterium]
MASNGKQTRPWIYTLNRGLAQLVPLSFGYWLSVPISDIFYLLWGRKRETARRNHARILGRRLDDPIVERMAHRTFRQFGRYIVELLSVQGWSLEAMSDRIDIEGGEHFAEATALGKGIIFTGAHMGSIEVASALVLLKGFQISSVAEQLNPKILMDWLTACRAEMGVELLPAAGAGMTLVRRLRRSGMVALVVDMGVTGGDGVTVEFLGHETVFPAGPARLARISGAPIIFGWAARLRRGRYLAHVSPPILSDRGLSPEEDARQVTRRIVAEFEQAVRRYPEQWYVFREMWLDGGREAVDAAR